MQTGISAKERTFGEYARLLYRSKWAVGIIFCTVVASSVIFSFVARPVYEAQSVVIIEPRVDKEGLSSVLDVSGYMAPSAFDVSVINNQVEILKSYSVGERTIGRLKELYGTERVSLFHSDQGVPSQHVMVKRLHEKTSIVPLRDTDIIEIRVRAGNPWEAAAIANVFASTYVEESTSDARAEVRDVKAFLEEQLSTAKERLAQAEEQLKAYQEKEKVASLSDETVSLVDKLAYFGGLYNEAQVDLQTAQKRLHALSEQLAAQQSSLVDEVAQVSSPVISQLRDEIASLEAIRSKYLAQGYGENHEKMMEIEKRIEDTRARLLDTAKKVAGSQLAAADPVAFSQSLVDKILGLQVEVEAMAARVNALKSVADVYEKELEKLPEKSLQLARLERAAKVSENVLTMLMEKHEESRITEAGQTGVVRIIDMAREPDEPVRPRKKLNVLVGCVLGALLSLGYMSVKDRVDRTIVEVEEVENLPGVPVLGWIPAIRNSNGARRKGRAVRERGGASTSASDVERRLLVHLEPHSPVSESYRALRTNIKFVGVDAPVKTMVVSSPGPSEGKSTTVANLAITMAQAGARTLLVDSDLRRPTLDGILATKNGFGLTDVLAGSRPLEECITKTEVENLSIIGAGTLPPNPSEILGSEKMKKIVGILRESYDYVLFDSPPILAVTDAVVLGALVDLTVIVVRSNRTRWNGLARAMTLLRNVRVKQIGTVLNGVQLDGLHSYYHDYYGYYKQHDGKR